MFLYHMASLSSLQKTLAIAMKTTNLQLFSTHPVKRMKCFCLDALIYVMKLDKYMYRICRELYFQMKYLFFISLLLLIRCEKHLTFG
jgi:hypothetical protein